MEQLFGGKLDFNLKLLLKSKERIELAAIRRLKKDAARGKGKVQEKMLFVREEEDFVRNSEQESRSGAIVLGESGRGI
jgi:hypothetical protein